MPNDLLRVIEAQFDQLVFKLTALLDQHASDPDSNADIETFRSARDKASAATELIRQHRERHS